MRAVVKKPNRPRQALEFWRMARLLLWAGFFAGLGLAHVHLRLATRDMAIQMTRLQAEWKDLLYQQSTIESQIAALRGGDRMLDYAQNKLHLVALPADQIVVWKIPRTVTERYDRAYSEVALARVGDQPSPRREPLMARLLGTVLSPEAQARPANSGP